MRRRSNFRDVPDTATGRAAAAALEAAERVLEREGVDTERSRMFVGVYGPGPGENCGTAGHGYTHPAELLDELLAWCRSIGKTMGLKMDLAFPAVKGQG